MRQSSTSEIRLQKKELRQDGSTPVAVYRGVEFLGLVVFSGKDGTVNQLVNRVLNTLSGQDEESINLRRQVVAAFKADEELNKFGDALGGHLMAQDAKKALDEGEDIFPDTTRLVA